MRWLGGELTFVKTQKATKKKKTQKIIYFLNSEKTMKTSFYCYKKNGFLEHIKQKHTPFPKQVFCVFWFQEWKTVLKNKNQK